MLGLSAKSPLVLPWATLRLAGRYALPLALWFTVGEALRYAVLYGGYHLGGRKGLAASVVPMASVSLLVMISLTVTVLMIHCVREGLAVVHAREPDGDLTPWAVGNDESVLGAMGRAVVPFVVFYLGWGIHEADVREFAVEASARGLTEQGFEGQIAGLRLLLSLERHLPLAVVLTVAAFALRTLLEWKAEDRLPRLSGLLIAFFEVNFALFAVFTLEQLRRGAEDWITSRRAWEWLDGALGGVLELWKPFQHAVLGGLIWIVIAGVVLGLDSRDHAVVLGRSRAGRRLAKITGAADQGTLREYLLRGLRELWLPAWYGLRLVRRSGIVPFGVFCLLFMALDVAEPLLRRQVYELLGPHPVEWWMPRLPLVGFGVGLVVQMLKVCLLAAAFNLVMARVTEQTAAKAAAPSPSPPAAGPPASTTGAWDAAPPRAP
ncbi:hypothetical protein HNR61_007194 [Actinomadura namibiensis]|uniref:Uncharacterized protein n=1 Tax=Actinomadura namibiensis TaxID=182080 RepID=A0A7W3LWE0_ACTNM|nr:hypothetical protein [Actinomadura namibiensis]MBA8955518.1 hypothetical protein [Actinomadura namibiensis]